MSKVNLTDFEISTRKKSPTEKHSHVFSNQVHWIALEIGSQREALNWLPVLTLD